MGSWFVLFHRPTLLSLTFHQMFGILLKQVLINVCSLCVVCFVVLHVSDPYIITCFTLELKMSILVCVIVSYIVALCLLSPVLLFHWIY